MTYRSLTAGLVALSLASTTFAVPPGEQSAPAAAVDAEANPLIVPDTPPAFDLAAKQIKRLTLSPGLSAEVFAAEPQLANGDVKKELIVRIRSPEWR